ncbi:MAG: squalene synthase HpnC [Rhodospirillaceae bacterium]|nr:squalene synthase HpnC [Rhodospirillaceae bacterium]
MIGSREHAPVTPSIKAMVETPSGKDVPYENFPVGSWLLPAHLRPHIAIFYAFARAADDIADNPDLGPEEKIRRLDGFESALLGRGGDDAAYGKARAMGASLSETGVTSRHCVDLLAAFKQDATKHRYHSWGDLIAYCALSAAPVGRFLLDLHGGSKLGYGPSDALCMALQIINHLQDCQDDFRTLDRVYLPMDWMTAAGARPEDLSATSTPTGLRHVIDWTLGGVDALLRDADNLPGALRSRRLAMESAVIIHIARALTGRLYSSDPLAARVELTKPKFLWCGLTGSLRGGFSGWL